MSLSDIKFVVDVKTTLDANKYLQKGWILIKTYTESYDVEICKDDLTLHYVLGAAEGVDYSEELAHMNFLANLKPNANMKKF